MKNTSIILLNIFLLISCAHFTSVSSDAPKTEVVFELYSSGIVYDKTTGLEWYFGQNKDTNWYETKIWVDSLTVSGGGWRVPTRDELKTLYYKNKVKVIFAPLANKTGWCVWCKKNDSEDGIVFTFSGGYSFTTPYTASCDNRKVAVRYSNKSTGSINTQNSIIAASELSKEVFD